MPYNTVRRCLELQKKGFGQHSSEMLSKLKCGGFLATSHIRFFYSVKYIVYIILLKNNFGFDRMDLHLRKSIKTWFTFFGL